MTYRRAVADLSSAFERAGLDEARRHAEWIVEDVCATTRTRRIAHPETIITDEAWARCQALAQRRLQREPIQYVLGYAEFYGLRFHVTPDVLIPRPETEQLVELVEQTIAPVKHARVLDVGTGSGCIAVALVKRKPEVRAWACDVEPSALRVAYLNAKRLAAPVLLYLADALQSGFARALAGSLDAIISNPPYVPLQEEETLAPEVRSYEPHRALFPPRDPLAFYRSITAEAAAVLRPNGWLFFEVHEDWGSSVPAILEVAGFVDVKASTDFAGKLRFVHGRCP